MAAGLGLVLVGGFQPLLRSGRAWRTSYAVVRTAHRLGLVGSGYQSVLAACWYLVPLLCGLTLTALILERRRLAYVGAAVVAGLALVMAGVAFRARLPSGRGATILLAGALLVIGGLVRAAADRSVRSVRPSRSRHGAPAREMPGGVTLHPGRWRRSTR